MPVDVNVHGHDGFHKVAAAFHKAAAVDWDRELNGGLEKAGEVVAKEIRSSSAPYMPAGYEEVFAASMVTKVSLVRRGIHRAATVAVRAFGRRGHERQAEKLEKGLLKHKFWGRWVNVPQAWQRIRPGFVTEPARRAIPEATREIDKACHRITDKIERAM